MSDESAPVMTPELQAQLAALQQQAMAQLQALVEALRALEGQLPPPDDEPGSTIAPWVAPPEPVLLPPDFPPELPPREVSIPEPKGLGEDGTGMAVPPDLHPFARLAVMPAEELPPDDMAIDMLAVLRPEPAAPEPASFPGGGGATPAVPETTDWTWPDLHRAGAEGGTF